MSQINIIAEAFPWYIFRLSKSILHLSLVYMVVPESFLLLSVTTSQCTSHTPNDHFLGGSQSPMTTSR